MLTVRRYINSNQVTLTGLSKRRSSFIAITIAADRDIADKTNIESMKKTKSLNSKCERVPRTIFNHISALQKRAAAADEVIILPVRPSASVRPVFGHPRCAVVSKGCEGHRGEREKEKKKCTSFGVCLALAGHFPTCRPD